MSDPMTELPVPPNVPEWLSNVHVLDGSLTWNATRDGGRVDYLRAAVYAQLWREEMQRLMSEWSDVQSYSAPEYQESYLKAEANAETCARRMRELNP